MNLFEYTYCGNYNRQIQNLARIVPEKWSFGENEDNGILKGYLEHTFRRIYEEGKILETEEYAIFNTGLFNLYYPESGAGQAALVSGWLLYRIPFVKIRNRQSSEAGGICKESRRTDL